MHACMHACIHAYMHTCILIYIYRQCSPARSKQCGRIQDDESAIHLSQPVVPKLMGGASDATSTHIVYENAYDLPEMAIWRLHFDFQQRTSHIRKSS